MIYSDYTHLYHFRTYGIFCSLYSQTHQSFLGDLFSHFEVQKSFFLDQSLRIYFISKKNKSYYLIRLDICIYHETIATVKIITCPSPPKVSLFSFLMSFSVYLVTRQPLICILSLWISRHCTELMELYIVHFRLLLPPSVIILSQPCCCVCQKLISFAFLSSISCSHMAQFTHLSIDIYLGCFQFGTITN